MAKIRAVNVTSDSNVPISVVQPGRYSISPKQKKQMP
jgi:hypothetical protein